MTGIGRGILVYAEGFEDSELKSAFKRANETFCDELGKLAISDFVS